MLNWRDDASPRDSARDSCAYILSAVLLRICSPFKGEIVSSTLPYSKINMARSSTGTLHQHTQGDICDASGQSCFPPRNMVWLTGKTRKRVTNHFNLLTNNNNNTTQGKLRHWNGPRAVRLGPRCKHGMDCAGSCSQECRLVDVAETCGQNGILYTGYLRHLLWTVLFRPRH